MRLKLIETYSENEKRKQARPISLCTEMLPARHMATPFLFSAPYAVVAQQCQQSRVYQNSPLSMPAYNWREIGRACCIIQFCLVRSLRWKWPPRKKKCPACNTPMENLRNILTKWVSECRIRCNHLIGTWQNRHFNFPESFVPGELTQFTNQSYRPNSTNQTDFFYSMRQSISPGREITYSNSTYVSEVEASLLEELEIYPERILHKSLLILNPFHVNKPLNETIDLIHESDLAGPIVFCLLFGVCLFVAGSKVHFGYIYGLSMISVLGMYAFLLMMTDGMCRLLTFSRVASALGYGILPIVWLSIFSIFVSLNSTIGFVLVTMCTTLATMGASQMLCLLANVPDKRLLIAYPCALVYIAFTFFVLFWRVGKENLIRKSFSEHSFNQKWFLFLMRASRFSVFIFFRLFN